MIKVTSTTKTATWHVTIWTDLDMTNVCTILWLRWPWSNDLINQHHLTKNVLWWCEVWGFKTNYLQSDVNAVLRFSSSELVMFYRRQSQHIIWVSLWGCFQHPLERRRRATTTSLHAVRTDCYNTHRPQLSSSLRSISDNAEEVTQLRASMMSEQKRKFSLRKRSSGFLKKPDMLETVYSVEDPEEAADLHLQLWNIPLTRQKPIIVL